MFDVSHATREEKKEEVRGLDLGWLECAIFAGLLLVPLLALLAATST
jgi:hypothetical protein